jgi:hypothetical protein
MSRNKKGINHLNLWNFLCEKRRTRETITGSKYNNTGAETEATHVSNTALRKPESQLFALAEPEPDPEPDLDPGWNNKSEESAHTHSTRYRIFQVKMLKKCVDNFLDNNAASNLKKGMILTTFL